MTALDWIVLAGTTFAIIAWGLWRTRGAETTSSYLHGGYEMRWQTIGLSVMATQASAITFLSLPGQAYEDGMRFVQFYFGLPIAMVLISKYFIPIYYKLRVITAYEYLESRFDLKTRQLAAVLFLVQRGLSTGITIYAPAIILSAVLGWPLEPTIVAIGGIVILYTVAGGSKAVSQTQKQQMIVMLGGMAVAAVVIVMHLPKHVSFGAAVDLAGAFGRMNIVSFSFDIKDRYNVWSGVTGGLFLSLSYFGTDQSQVGRYLTGRSITESRLGLLFNGVVKIPMQFLILSVGVLVFVFYQFTAPPIVFNEPLLRQVQATPQAAAMTVLEADWQRLQRDKLLDVDRFLAARAASDKPGKDRAREALRADALRAETLRQSAKTLIRKAVPGAETKDADYIFITFVTHYLPSGLVGLLVAVIIAAALGSTASELNGLGSTTTVDLYRRLRRSELSDAHTLRASKLFTVLWGLLALGFALFASLLDNLIQAVIILGSIFYGTVLGIFMVAFFLRRIRGTAVFWAAVVSQATVALLFAFTAIGFLWYNVIGCAGVMLLGWIFEQRRDPPEDRITELA